ncbi:MAG: hypothetical protein ACI8RZ_003989 [Myxococcota bacterium]|jgi:hypothetical protein
MKQEIIWLVDQVVDPFRAQLGLALMGIAVQLVSFTPAQDPMVQTSWKGMVKHGNTNK